MGVRKNIRKAKAARYAKGAKSRNKPRSERKLREVKHKLWNNKETLINNYNSWGIVTDPNKELDKKKTKETEAPTTQFLEELKERVDNKVVKKQKPHMAVEDKFAIEKLINKYGKDNIEDMYQDKKLNVYFWNPTQLKKMIARYEQINEDN